MKLGFIISMYDEIDIVKETITNLRKYDCKIIVIQSDPGNKEMILDGSICDKYEKMSDIAGNREEYAKIIEEKKKGKGEMIGPIALTRNFNKGHLLIQEFDIDYVIAITGDVKITNLIGITKIINKMNKQNKKIGGTRTIGYTMFDEFGKFAQFQYKDISNIMPQFFISNIKSVREGLFCNTERTNKYTTEQCFGDEIVRYAKEKNMSFFNVFYRICDYGYPRFINGLYYNPEQISRIPPPFEGFINWIRYHSSQKINDWITKQFLKIEKSKK
jgi:hypothetical protein